MINIILTPNLAKSSSDPNSTFLMNLEMAFSSALRNLGFIRDNHTEYLLFNGDRLAGRRQNLENIADFASFSGSGLFAKLGSFIGVGSLTDFLSKTNLSLIWLPYFAIGGVIGAFAVTILVRLYVSQTDDSWDRQTEKNQNRYWKEHYKKDVTNELYNLYLSIIGLIEKFYPDKKDEIIKNDELLKDYNRPEHVKSVIREQIVAPDDLLWFPMIQASKTNGQTASGQTQTADSQSTDKSTDMSKNSAGKSTTKSKSS